MTLRPGRGRPLEGTNASLRLLEALPHTDQLPEDTKKMYEQERCQNDTLTFSTSRVRFGRSVYPGVVDYRLKYDDETGEVVGLYRRHCTLDRDLKDAQEELVSRYIISLDIEYQNAQGDWLAQWRASQELPRAVRLTVGTLPRLRTLKRPEMALSTTVVNLPAGRRISQ
jgi:hypothetical protein